MSGKKNKAMRKLAKEQMQQTGKPISTEAKYYEDTRVESTARNANELHLRTKILKKIYKKFQQEGQV